MNPSVSIILIKSRDEQYREALQWIETQTCHEDIEVVCLENQGNANFSSAASALNSGAARAMGEVLIFMHQDVYLWDPEFVAKYRDHLLENQDVILGVAGADAAGTVYTDIYETKDKLQRNPPTGGGFIPVVSVDECVIAMHRRRWETLRFDEDCCDDWHCYGMDICFANTLAGGRNLVLSAPICHDSLGNPEQIGFWLGVKKLVEKYRGTAIRNITGCCVNIPCTRYAYLKYYLTHRVWYPLDYRRRQLLAALKKKA